MTAHKRFLLLGGNGFIGRNLALALADHGKEVFIFDTPESLAHNPLIEKPAHITVVPGTIQQTAYIEELIKNQQITIVVNLVSTLVPGSSPDEFIADMSRNFPVLLDLFQKLPSWGVLHVVHFSSGGAIYEVQPSHSYDEETPLAPLSFHGWQKVCLDYYLELMNKLTGLKYLIIRPSNPYGRFQNPNGRQGLISVAFGKILRNEPVEIWGNGSAIRDYIYIDDLTKAVCDLIEGGHWEQIVNVGSGEGKTVLQVLELIETVAGRKLEKIFVQPRMVDLSRMVLNTNRLQSLIPFKPTSMEAGLKGYWRQLNASTGR
jgi:UDP-glucose 4-epimerase